MNDLLGLLALFFLVLMNGYFVAAEFALVSVRRTRIEQLAEEGNAPARLTHRALQNLDLYIAATQLGITMASLAIGFVAEPAIEHLLHPVLERMDLSIPPQWEKAIPIAVAFAVSTILHIVFGELAPKSLALQRSEQVSLAIIRPLLFFTAIFKWAIVGLNALGNGVVRLLGLKAVAGHHTAYSEEEIRMIVSASSQEGVLEDSEKELVYNVFDLSDTTAREVMTPRMDMVVVDGAAPLRRLLELNAEHGYSRIPVFQDTADNIVGIAHTNDVLKHLEELDHLTIADVMRPVFFVPEGMKIKDLLAKMRDKKSHMSIVVDEFGGTAGLATLEDALEEIVGEIYDETDEDEIPLIEVLGEGLYLMDGSVTIHEVEERLGNELEEGEAEYGTLAGFMTSYFGDIPEVGQSFIQDGWAFTVEEADQRRVARVRVERAAQVDPLSGQAAEELNHE
ncbi:hemolysin family protein [Deinococcus antarcticus]|uniref:Hemolysin family protein n=1 Tax=Deinococcus antarcticus TaxID=1298767 RepID=A0ABV8A9Y0_9DEIO